MNKAEQQKGPEKIYNWLNSQLSIARFYGSIRIYGALYVIDESDKDLPLVRSDVLHKEAKEASEEEKEKKRKNAREFWEKQKQLI